MYIKYITQIKSAPPLFGIFSNHPNLITKSSSLYLRHISNCQRFKLNLVFVQIKTATIGIAMHETFRDLKISYEKTVKVIILIFLYCLNILNV